MLQHPLLARSARVAAAAENRPALAEGERGDAVRRLQLALLACGEALPRSTKEQTATPDAIFGRETADAVRAFQKAQRLAADGVAGKMTLEKIDGLLPRFVIKQACCANSKQGNGPRECELRQMLAGANFRGVTSASFALPAGVSLPTGLRFLTAAQQATASTVFAGSLDFTRILLSDATGIGGRAFTVHIELVGGLGFVVINAGTFSPSRDLLVHELAHAWQSQHSVNPKQFMVNSVESQGIAEALRLLGADASAYYFKPGRSFARYGAEQIACQVEKGVGSIVTVIRSLPPHIPHPLNELSLAVPHWEVSGPGVDSSC